MSVHPAPVPTSPVQSRPKRADVRARILASAQQSFTEHGYQRTSLDDVAARAGFSKGAVYSNFGGKADLFTAVINQQTGDATDAVLDSAEQLVAAVSDPEGPVRLAETLTEQLVRNQSNHHLLAEFRSLATADPDLSVVYDRMRHDQRQQLLDTLHRKAAELDLQLQFDDASATLLLVVAQSLAIEHAAAPEAMPAELIKETLTITIRGVLR